MNRLLLIAVLLLIGVVGLVAQGVDDLEFITEDYAPLNFEKDGKLQGIAVDLLGEMLKMTGAKKGIGDIKLWPWARGYQTVQSKKNAVLFSMARTEAREKLFKWVGPLVPSHVAVIAPRSKGIKIESPADFARYKVGTVRDDIGEQLLVQLGVKKEKLTQTNSGASTAKMLLKGRIDMWAYERDVAFWNIQEAGGKGADFEVVYSLKKGDYYIALHRDTEDAVVASLQKALDELKAAGKVQKIVEKYVR